MIRNQIGPFQFISLSRAISGPRRRLVREVRTGRNGTTFWRVGKGGKPFTVVSAVDAADGDSAEELVHQYEALVGENPVLVVWQGKNLNPLKVVVLDVEPLDEGVHATLLGIGGTLGSSHGFNRCVWTLESVDPFQDLASYS